LLKFFGHSNFCNILLKFPITSEDYATLRSLFSKSYSSWSIDFGFIYTVEKTMITLLYKEIFENYKIIKIITYRYKFARYLHRLGFRVNFKQPIHNSALNLEKVEIVLVGGSVGSTSKIINIVKNICLDNLTLIIVQHVEKEPPAKFDEILQSYTKYKVLNVEDGDSIKKV